MKTYSVLTKKIPPRSRGHFFEELAKDYLVKKGLTFITKNFYCKMGEIDLIMHDKTKMLIFIEVRYRSSLSFGNPSETISAAKQNRLRKTALFYMASHKLDVPCRFDVIAICPAKENSGNISHREGPYQIDWIPNAIY